MIVRTMFAAMLIAVCGTASLTQDFEAGREAYDRGAFELALEEFRPLAERGHADAQYFLGYMYDWGDGVSENDAEAARWYRRAAEQGHAGAQLFLGHSYNFGEGVSEDDTEAAAWYRRAADQEDADAQFYLGLMYAKGEGVPQDLEQAHAWVGEGTVFLQRALLRLGLDPGPVDGSMGPRTRAAIREFQQARGLSVNGEASRSLERALWDALIEVYG